METGGTIPSMEPHNNGDGTNAAGDAVPTPAALHVLPSIPSLSSSVVASACLPCYSGKRACDGVQPVCGRCIQIGRSEECIPRQHTVHWKIRQKRQREEEAAAAAAATPVEDASGNTTQQPIMHQRVRMRCKQRHATHLTAVSSLTSASAATPATVTAIASSAVAACAAPYDTSIPALPISFVTDRPLSNTVTSHSERTRPWSPPQLQIPFSLRQKSNDATLSQHLFDPHTHTPATMHQSTSESSSLSLHSPVALHGVESPESTDLQLGSAWLMSPRQSALIATAMAPLQLQRGASIFNAPHELHLLDTEDTHELHQPAYHIQPPSPANQWQHEAAASLAPRFICSPKPASRPRPLAHVSSDATHAATVAHSIPSLPRVPALVPIGVAQHLHSFNGQSTARRWFTALHHDQQQQLMARHGVSSPLDSLLRPSLSSVCASSDPLTVEFLQIAQHMALLPRLRSMLQTGRLHPHIASTLLAPAVTLLPYEQARHFMRMIGIKRFFVVASAPYAFDKQKQHQQERGSFDPLPYVECDASAAAGSSLLAHPCTCGLALWSCRCIASQDTLSMQLPDLHPLPLYGSTMGGSLHVAMDDAYPSTDGATHSCPTLMIVLVPSTGIPLRVEPSPRTSHAQSITELAQDEVTRRATMRQQQHRQLSYAGESGDAYSGSPSDDTLRVVKRHCVTQSHQQAVDSNAAAAARSHSAPRCGEFATSVLGGSHQVCQLHSHACHAGSFSPCACPWVIAQHTGCFVNRALVELLGYSASEWALAFEHCHVSQMLHTVLCTVDGTRLPLRVFFTLFLATLVHPNLDSEHHFHARHKSGRILPVCVRMRSHPTETGALAATSFEFTQMTM